MKNIDFTKLIPHLISLLVIVSLSIAYFYPQLQGKTINKTDITQFKAMSKEAADYAKKTGEPALWTGSLFSGMPTVQISLPNTGNLVKKFEKILSFGFSRPIGYFIYGMICFYIMLIALGVNHWLSLVGSIAFVFGTGYIGLYEAGHATKIVAVFSSPPIIAGLLLVFRNKLILGGLLFAFFLALNLGANHPQMSYYLAMVLIFPVIIHAVKQFRDKKSMELGKQFGVLLLGVLLALGAGASKILPTIEYTKSTMRGAPILEKPANEQESSSNTEGLSWDYAMNWSNNSKDLLSSFIPYAVGGSSSEKLKNDSYVIKKAPNLRNQPLPLYWGGLPSTSMPYYFGALVFFLFVFGAVVIKGPLKWWILAGVGLTMIMSMGSNFALINRPLFDYLPLLNKFRTPNSVLTITNLFIPLLGVLGLQKILDQKKKEAFIKPLLYTFGALGGLCLVLAVLGGSLFDFSSQIDGRIGQIAPLMKETRSEYLTSSAMKSFVIMAIGFGLIYFYLKGKIKSLWMIVGIGLVIVFDLFSVDKNYIGTEDFVNKRQVENTFSPRPVDSQILQDPDPHYRVFDLTSANPFGEATPAYFHKLIGGYSPAKLQRYDDIITRYLSRNYQPVVNMLNGKYYISNGGENGAPAVSRNPSAFGNAWFVENVSIVQTPNEEIDALEKVDLSNTAVVHQEFQSELGATSFTGQGSMTLTEYTPDKLTYQAVSTSPQLAVFSEIWYEPGWNVTIDDQKADMIRVNYLLRGLPIPAGNHTIVFEFAPTSYTAGKTISYISSLILIIGFLGLLFYKLYWEKRQVS